MKYLMLFVCMVAFSGLAVSQSCHAKAMAASSKSGCCSMKEAAAMVAADKVGIQVRKDVATGEYLFFKSSNCHYSAASYVEVSFDASEGTFVNKAPESAEMKLVPVSNHNTTEVKKMDCSKMTKAECAEKMAKGECQGKAKT